MRERIAQAAATLRAGGVASARMDAELLLAHTLGVTRADLWTQPDIDVPAFDDLIARRAAREPLQYLLGTVPFRHQLLAVGPGVFIPRPETEHLIDLIVPRLPARPVVVDLCAGAGALGLAVATEVDSAQVYAVERSTEALPWLRRNAADRLVVVAGDVTDPRVVAELDGRVDAVVANPPYVPDGVLVGAEVRHDPPEAVFAGPDGLDLMPAVIAAAARLLKPGGLLGLEHDDTQGRSVPRLLLTGPWDDVVDHVDLTGRPRFATAVRRVE